MREAPQRALLIVLGSIAVALSACGSPGGSVLQANDLETRATARTELRAVIEDVAGSTAYRYRLRDDLGRDMGPMQVIWVPEAERFAAVYFTWSDGDQAFHVHLATSLDLLGWTWETDLASLASQPSIAPSSDGGYVVAWEQEPDPIHNVITYFATWEDLRTGRPTRRFDVPVTMPACGEGTPSIEAASSQRVDIGFHYHGGCERDLQAGGTTDWTTWSATPRHDLDQRLMDQGVAGHIGDRDDVTFRGVDLMVLEGETVVGEWSSWRMFLIDEEDGTTERLDIRTHAGSAAFSNATVDLIEVGGREAVLVTVYLFTEGAKGEEDGELLYYRILEPAGG